MSEPGYVLKFQALSESRNIYTTKELSLSRIPHTNVFSHPLVRCADVLHGVMFTIIPTKVRLNFKDQNFSIEWSNITEYISLTENEHVQNIRREQECKWSKFSPNPMGKFGMIPLMYTSLSGDISLEVDMDDGYTEDTYKVFLDISFIGEPSAKSSGDTEDVNEIYKYIERLYRILYDSKSGWLGLDTFSS